MKKQVLTVAGVGFSASGRPPRLVVVEVLTLLTVPPLGIVGTLTLAVHLSRAKYIIKHLTLGLELIYLASDLLHGRAL